MLDLINKILWFIAIFLLFGGGIYFSVKLKFPQFRLVSVFKKFINSNSEGSSAFETLSISLAARIGVGSLSGIALAIFIGGPGTVFWIWIVGIITSINVFCETYLGVKYNNKDNNEYNGGPAFYIEKTLKTKKIAILYALFVILAYIVGFMTIQSNTISVLVTDAFNVDIFVVAAILVVVSAISIIKGLSGITKITTMLIPLMGVCYIVLSVIIILSNINNIPKVLYDIFSGAWNFKALGSGFLSVFVIGMQRGIFCTEAGLGTGAIATSSSYPENKINFSLGQILGIYFTVFIVCTSTAIIILTSDYNVNGILVSNGIELTQYALVYHLGEIGNFVLIILVIFLSYSTIIAGYYYGESNFKYLIKNYKKGHIYVLKILTLILLFLGSIINSGYLWSIVDIFIAILAIINMYTLIKNRTEIILDYKKNMRK